MNDEQNKKSEGGAKAAGPWDNVQPLPVQSHEAKTYSKGPSDPSSYVCPRGHVYEPTTGTCEPARAPAFTGGSWNTLPRRGQRQNRR